MCLDDHLTRFHFCFNTLFLYNTYDAMVRLDELWEGNDFHRGDKMRINEVRAVLKRIKEQLLRQQ